ncbi:FimV/HubP family polar landmark protein [Marinobacter sp. HN1S83]|uniref:FimV/HubP family polar landmark protein n=1 Tax=Marinobacter sp. HN1S83 TaxID=3382301 RepID=UPI00387A8AF0
MKVRKLAVALALAGGLGSGVAQALGLGEIELQSYLNEPLEADINLRKSRGIDPDDVFVNIASEGDYQRVGIDRNYFLTKLKFEVTTSSDGNLIVNVSSREPLREPYLNFLLEVTWPSGRLMREYSLLVDPPVYAEESGIQEQVSAPATRQSTTPEASTGTSQPSGQRLSDGTSSSRTTAGPRTLGPTNSSDTLWQIAQSVKPNDSVSTQQVMLAIQDLNSDAFIDGNINRLKRGEVLRVPDLEQIRSRSRGEANRQVSMQNEALSSQTRTVDATESRSSDEAAPDTAGAGGDELRLIAADDSGSRDSEDGGSAGGDGQTAGGVDAGSAVAMEELESARRETEELNSRVEDLQDQVETLQRLLELKDSQLAEMQQMGGDEETSATAQPGEDKTMDEDPMAADDEIVGQGEPEQPVSEDQDVAGESTETADATGESAEAGGPEGLETGDDVAEANGDLSAAKGDEPAEEDMAAANDTGLSGQDGPGPEEGADDPAPGTQPSVTEPNTTEEPATQPAAPAQQSDKGFPGNVIDAITNNPLYQIALGGGLILLLLLLLLLARRNANREKAFYEQLNGEEGDGSDTFDLSLEDDEPADTAAGDPMAEAETYIAYGQMDKAAQSLETAISREPSRTDLRLKLLGVYADTQDRESFDKQFREIEALEDDSAIAEAGTLRERLDEAESMPSIDDLESQLRSDSFGREEETSGEETVSSESGVHLTNETLGDQGESGQPEQSTDELEQFDTDFSDLELTEEPEVGQKSESEADSDDGTIEYDLSGIEGARDDEVPAVEGVEDDDDLSFDFEDSSLEGDADTASVEASDDLSDELSLEDFDSLESDLTTDDAAEKANEAPSLEEPVEGNTREGEGLGDLDESFLDELDAELDKVADESGDDPLAGEESGMDDLELDVSDEDLALMEEFSESGDADTPEVDAPETEEPAPELDEELDLEDSLMDNKDETPEELSDLGETDEFSADASETSEETDVEPPVASDSLDADSRKTAIEDLDESDLGDDDDFDFLAGTDEAATKLDLARAYIEMGDVDGARDILEEVSLEGSDEQKTEAQDLLKNLS